MPSSNGGSGCAAYFLDWVDSLEVFVELRGNWSGGQRPEVMSTLDEARDVYKDAFRDPPLSFSLLTPEEGESLNLDEVVVFDWQMNGDNEESDRVQYLFQVSPVPDFIPAVITQWFDSAPQSISIENLEPNTQYWWRVRAFDRGDNITASVPEARTFETFDSVSHVPGDDEPGSGGHSHPHAFTEPFALLWPSPAADRIELRLVPYDADLTRIEIYDSAGRLVGEYAGPAAASSAGFRPLGSGRYVGRFQDQNGMPLVTGRYWVQLSGIIKSDRATGQTWQFTAPLLIVR